MKSYNQNNFHKHTFCLWQEIHFSEIENLPINYKSKSGSEYIISETGVYRLSNHWGRAANCRWRLIPLDNYKNQQTKVGFAKWTDFYPNNENEKLFFIQVDFNTNKIYFNHKSSLVGKETFVLRNARDTSMRIKIIKEILTETAWSKHLEYENIDVLRNKIVYELISSDKSFIELKKEFV